ncbi:MAG: helix-turn-helix domain-containing protein [bacterium]|nr:helix-turn-helix domain-containing protein [bacterium]
MAAKKGKRTAAAGPRLYPEVMTIDEIADYLHLHKQVVYRHVKHGNIPVSRIGATIRFKKSVIDAWLEDSAMRNLKRPGGGGGERPRVEKEKFVWE